MLAAKGQSELGSRPGLYVVLSFLDAPSLVPAALVTHINWVHRLFRIIFFPFLFFLYTIDEIVEEIRVRFLSLYTIDEIVEEFRVRVLSLYTIEELVEELMFVSCHFKVHSKILAAEIVTFNSHYTVTYLLLLSVIRWLLNLLGRLLETRRVRRSVSHETSTS